MISAFVSASITVDGVTNRYDFGLAATDIAKQTDEELTNNGILMGKAYAKLLIQARNGELEEQVTLPQPTPPEDPTPSPEAAE